MEIQYYFIKIFFFIGKAVLMMSSLSVLVKVFACLFYLVLAERRKWVDGSFGGPPTGYNILLASGGALVSIVKEIERLVEGEGYKVKRRTGSQHCYLSIRGNSHETDTV